jgi:ABC-type amino acid transport substrate-binding protein/tetratricopeptide (TPR) repeat protein
MRGSGVTIFQGDYETARAQLEESLEFWQASGDPANVPPAVIAGLGVVALYQSRFDDALDLGEQSLAAYRRRGSSRGVAMALHNLGTIEYGLARPEFGLARFEAAEPLLRETGDATTLALCLCALATSRIRLGDLAGARRSLAEAFQLLDRMDTPRERYYALDGLAWLALALGRHAQAAGLAGAADAARDALKLIATQMEAAESKGFHARLDAALGAAEAGRERAAGRAWTPEHIRAEVTLLLCGQRGFLRCRAPCLSRSGVLASLPYDRATSRKAAPTQFPWLAGLLCLAVALIFHGCSPAKDPSAVTAEDTTAARAAEDSGLAHVEDPIPPELLAGAGVPWTGDFDGMVKRRVIRVLVVYNQTHYFFDGLRPRGISYDALVEFERLLNKSLGSRHLKVHLIHIPVTRDRLLPMLVSGQGDLAVGNITITPERAKQVAFSDPIATNVSEVVVTHIGGPTLKSLADLAGREVWVRPSSSYYEPRRAQPALTEGRKPVVIRPRTAPRDRGPARDDAAAHRHHDRDDHMANFWAGVFDSLQVHRNSPCARGAGSAGPFARTVPSLRNR